MRCYLDRSDRPTVAGERPHVTVTVAAEGLHGDLEVDAELDHVGPVGGETARRLACDASITRVVMSGSSEPLDVGRKAPATAGSPAAIGRRPGATRTTSCIGQTEDLRRCRTSFCSAGGTTGWCINEEGFGSTYSMGAPYSGERTDRCWRYDLLREANYPTEPSICSSIRRFSSTAYSIGSSRVIGSMKPLTIIAVASTSESPRLIR